MKVRAIGRLQSISASKDEAKVLVQGVVIDVPLQPGTKSKLLAGFSKGYTFVDIDFKATSPAVVFP